MRLAPTIEEAQAIRALVRLSRRRPSSLWLFSASGDLHVMRADADGGKVHLPGGAIDPAYVLATIKILNDGGDW